MTAPFSPHPDQPCALPGLDSDTLSESLAGPGSRTRPGPKRQIDLAKPRTQRVSINQLTTLRTSFDTDLVEYARAGVPAIGLSWRKLKDFGVQRGVRLVQGTQLGASSLGWVGGFTGQYGTTIKETVQEAKRAIRVAAQVKASNVIVLTGPLAGHITPHARRLVLEGIRELAGIAERYDVTLSLKPMSETYRKNWTFLHTLQSALDIVGELNSRHVRLAFGTYHHWQEDRVLDLLREAASLISLVQLSDWKPPRDENDQILPGEGPIRFGEILQSLEEGGYFGWLELEVWSRDLWKLRAPDLIRKCLASMTNVLDDTPLTSDSALR